MNETWGDTDRNGTQKEAGCMSTGAIAVCGPTFLDVVMAGMPHAPVLGEEMWVESSALTAGGAANQAVAVARLGYPVELITRLGNDRAGQIVRSVLEENKVGTAYATPVECQSVTVALAWDADRAMVTHGSDEGGALPEDFAPSVLIADLRAIDNNVAVVKKWRARGTKVIGDVGWDSTGAWRTSDLLPLAHCDYFVPNETEILHYARCFDVREAVSMIGQLVETDARIVVTRGGRGVVLGPDNYQTLPGISVDVVDATGAGDAFSAGLAVAVANGATEREAVSFALLLGALSVAKAGGAGSTPTASELAKRIEELDIPGSYDLEFVHRFVRTFGFNNQSVS
ncbi:MAG: carbohydrate kinase family protein [Actinomyces sp.]|uniref:carbohydrate kinase family protein n=1 Tax=Actinomyces sp. TaxID=29317 RepID=UPI001ED5971D|nr:carbohydrate kinase family protein [Actinomyces sp.]MBS5826684.1 carbohydrate kinase family protein [Actinomyces sp.]